MVYKSEIVIDKIKKASKSEDVRLIIDKFVTRLAIKNNRGKIDRKYTMNILMALEYHKFRELEPLILKNLSLAIDVVKSIDANTKENPW